MENIPNSREFYTSSDLESILVVAEKWSGSLPLQKLKESLSAQSFQLNSSLYGESNLSSETAILMREVNYTDLREMKAIGKNLTFIARNKEGQSHLFDGETLINYGEVYLNGLTDIGGELAFKSST
jgi:hypothetical protein